MKKGLLCVALCLLVLLGACTREPYMDVFRLIKRFNAIDSPVTIAVEDLISNENEHELVYFVYLPAHAEGSEYLLRFYVDPETQYVRRSTLTVSLAEDETLLQDTPLTHFLDTLALLMSAYTTCTLEEAQQHFEQRQDVLRGGAHYWEKDAFRCSVISNALGSTFSIEHGHLNEDVQTDLTLRESETQGP